MPNNVAPPLREPTVEIYQIVAAVPSPDQPLGLPPCCIAPNYQIVRAQDSEGNFRAAALMGVYQDLDETITYPLPGIQTGAVFDADSLRVWLAIGASSQELDGPNDETLVIISTTTAPGVALEAVGPPATYRLTDSLQIFDDAGVIGSDDPGYTGLEGADYVVRMNGTDNQTHDFPILEAHDTYVIMGEAPDGDVAPELGATLDYEVYLNPAKFAVNAAATPAALRVNSQDAEWVVVNGVLGTVTWTAVPRGAEGNDITVEHSTSADAFWHFVLVGRALEIQVPAGGTVAQAIIAVAASPIASQLITGVETAPGAILDPYVAAGPDTDGSHIIYTAVVDGAGSALRMRYLDAGDDTPLALSVANGFDITVQLQHVVAVPSTTDDEIADAIMNPLNPIYDPDVADIITAVSYGGAGVADDTFLTTYTAFDDGEDANSVTVDADLIGNDAISGLLYVEYRALSLRWTSQASQELTGNDPQLITIRSPEDIETYVGEISPDNPLGLMLYMATINYPGGVVYGLGIDAVSVAYPDGTDNAWGRAISFMTSEWPYYISFGSQREIVHQMWEAHSDYMNGDGLSVPAVLERWIFMNKEMPTETPDELIGNGEDMLDTAVARRMTAPENFLLLDVVAGDILLLGTALDPYEVGAEVTLQNGRSGYIIQAVDTDPYTLILLNVDVDLLGAARDWSIYRPGAPLQVGGVWLKDELAEAINLMNQQGKRKMASTFPDNCVIPLDGTQYLVPGFYLDAAQVGRLAAHKTSDDPIGEALIGIDAVRFSTDFFGDDQLAVIQGGGVWTYHQEVPGGPVVGRMPVTTDLTNALTRNPICTWQVDKYTRTCRTVGRRTMGGVITTTLLDEIATKFHNIGKYQAEKNHELDHAIITRIEQGDGVTVDYDNIIVDGEAFPLQSNRGIKFYLVISAA